MAIFGNPFRRPRPVLEAKASAARGGAPARLETWLFAGMGAQWSGRSYASLVRRGMAENPVVQRCVRIVSQSIAAVPWRLEQEGRALIQHPLLDLLRRPNPLLGGAEFIEALIGYLLLAGDAFIERVDDSEGAPAELHVLRPDRMHILAGASGWPEAYEYRAGGAKHRFPVDPISGASSILHIREFDPLDDHLGLSALDAAARGLDLHGAVDGWNKALLDNAARPSGALVFEPRDGAPALSEEQFLRLKKEMEENFQGSGNAGRPLLLEGGLKWQQMAFSPSDMDYHATKNAAARDIALAFGVPPMLLGIPGDNTYANYQEANRALWRLSLLPLLGKLAGALDRWLAPAFGGGLKLDFDRNAIPALLPEREALWRMVAAASFLTDAEKRVVLGLPLLPARMRDGEDVPEGDEAGA
ncbi:MAG: phage portal protein [Pseudomonadota bacterium]